jgi:hypothetical protein
MSDRALMAMFDRGERLNLPGGYWLQKDDNNRWQVGRGKMFMGFNLSSNIPVGPGGSMDHEIREFAEAMIGATYPGNTPATDGK